MAGITMAQLAQVERDPVTKFLQMNLLRDSKIMEYIPWETVKSLKVNAQYWETLPTGGAWRALNEGYSSAENGNLADSWEALYLFGGDITFDKVVQQVDTIKDPVQLQIEGKTKSMSLQFNNYFINGDVASDPKGINGLKKRISLLPSRQTVYWTAAGATALDPTASAVYARQFLNRLRRGIHNCNGGQVDIIACNEDFQLAITAALLYAQSTGNYMGVNKDSWDREVVTYRGIPLVDMGYQNDLSTEIIPVTETALDGGSDSTSVYPIAFNTEEGVHGVQVNQMNFYDPLNGGEMESKPSKMRRLDWIMGLASFGTRCAVRMPNLSQYDSFTEH